MQDLGRWKVEQASLLSREEVVVVRKEGATDAQLP